MAEVEGDKLQAVLEELAAIESDVRVHLLSGGDPITGRIVFVKGDFMVIARDKTDRVVVALRAMAYLGYDAGELETSKAEALWLRELRKKYPNLSDTFDLDVLESAKADRMVEKRKLARTSVAGRYSWHPDGLK